MSALKYRSDIDGLRAVAVVPVILYHVGSAIAPGGYVGVDIFFVISGFLITTLIRDEIEAGDFSILRFYERRARRILPALFVTCMVTLAVALLVFMPDELRDLGASLASVALFASNILFWQTADYFSGPVELKPLVHTWSLAVEEQYYILFPLFLIAIARWGKRRYVMPTLIVTILSFAISVALLWIDPTGNYYLLPSRAWELLVGSLLALGMVKLKSDRSAEIVAWLGLAAIIGSIALLNHDSPFPGPNALWPTLGAAAIIAAGSRTTTTVGRLLGAKPLVAIGLISYSLYLVHWPFIVFAQYVLLRPLEPVEQVGLVVAMVLAATLSWRFVERPFRNRHTFSQRAILGGAVGVIAISVALGGALFAAKGLPQRFPGLQAASVRNESEPAAAKCFVKKGWKDWEGDKCFLNPGTGDVAMLWGDSHANHYWRAIAALDPALKHHMLYYASAGCLPILDAKIGGRPDCKENNRHALTIIRDYHVKTVILSAYWGYTMNLNRIPPAALAKTVETLRGMGVRVKIIGDNPDYAFANPQFLAYRLSRRDHPDAPFRMRTRNDWDINGELEKIVGADNFYDPLKLLCEKRECLVYDRGNILMTDNAHFSPYGSKLVVRDMRGFLDR